MKTLLTLLFSAFISIPAYAGEHCGKDNCNCKSECQKCAEGEKCKCEECKCEKCKDKK